MRRLVQLAEDSYVQHKYATLQIQSRFKAGVGRGVDLEQANARLALAESNLSTEIANLHDVTARYQRIVGDAPPKQFPQMRMIQRVEVLADVHFHDPATLRPHRSLPQVCQCLVRRPSWPE